MKLSIRDNSLRLGFSRDQIESLPKARRRRRTNRFPKGRDFCYELENSPASVAPAAFFSDNLLTVRLPETTVLVWATTDQVAIVAEQVLVDGEKLAITVGKDVV